MTTTRRPRLPAAVPDRPGHGPRSILRLSVGPSSELLRALRDHPGAVLTIRMPGDPGYGDSSTRVDRAFSIESRREDQHLCGRCGHAVWVAYANPGPGSLRRNVAIACPQCGNDLAVAVPANVSREDVLARVEKVRA